MDKNHLRNKLETFTHFFSDLTYFSLVPSVQQMYFLSSRAKTREERNNNHDSINSATVTQSSKMNRETQNFTVWPFFKGWIEISASSLSDPTLFPYFSCPDHWADSKTKSGAVWRKRDHDMWCQRIGPGQNQTLPVDSQRHDVRAREEQRRRKDCVSKWREATFPDSPQCDAGRPGRIPVQAPLRNRDKVHQNASGDPKCVYKEKKTSQTIDSGINNFLFPHWQI